MVFKKADMPTEHRSAWRGGEGAPKITYICPGCKPDHWRFVGLMEFAPGESIGDHVHQGETELYYIVEGEGTVTENGEPVVVTAGDSVLTGNGAGHSIKNTGAGKLSVLAVIVND